MQWIVLAVAAAALGAAAPQAEAKGSVSVTFTTTPVPAPNNQYSPRNAVAVWVEGPGGTFVKTIGQWVQVRQQALVAWRAAAGNNDADAVTGASRANHAAPLTVTWNLRDRAGDEVVDGTYTIRMELAESNSNTAAQNNQGTFTFVKGPTADTQTGLTNGGFTGVSIAFDPNTASCADNIVEGNETCEPGIPAGQAGACPTACAAADACMPVELQGEAAMCNAVCAQLAPITACIDGDGCCAAGCSAAEDSDCVDDGAPTATGGCSTGSGTGGALAFAALGLALLVGRSRSRGAHRAR